MKKVLKNVSFMIFLLKSCLFLSQDLDAKKVIVIDPGHGGKESGAIGINGIQEKDVVLDIAEVILKLNKKLDEPLDIYLTRYTDTLISLCDRITLAKAIKADLFLSLHCNHSDNPNARGVEAYVANQSSGFSEEAIWLAFQLQADLNKKLGFESRGVKFADFQVLRETINDFPSVLVELGFLSNWDEARYLMKEKNVLAIVLTILKGLEIKKLGYD
ncbi:N-acetylmuramoyl-L-alanine amidase [Salegentibacter mishustinae]|uniref:N-acetylmuramoyl-L-alanine amidase n=1 Tax=Zunongwangia pacifica TaxID=2911062 RepID=A0A9X2A1Z1_9FLAO|nr:MULTISPECIES: N-acetylmuramoyl-L-alanine amidase [Bacteroidota]MCL6218614.1 N-acetylmuramoyl-L-alanine amidase [Zunongwangia pacifica]UBZ07672.1 N-acetylmuramoyl-L-alanine amidase [Salegentibacter mishustinae]|tara:strand:- start:2434 stop:3081 length:648 start_codon:yes stop_codon:yes gene_type:complete